MQVNRIGARPNVNFSGINIVRCRNVESVASTTDLLKDIIKTANPKSKLDYIVPSTVDSRDGILSVLVFSGEDNKYFAKARKILSGKTKYGKDGKCDGEVELNKAIRTLRDKNVLPFNTKVTDLGFIENTLRKTNNKSSEELIKKLKEFLK